MSMWVQEKVIFLKLQDITASVPADKNGPAVSG